MFLTIISPSTGATFNKLYSAIGTFVPVGLAAVWIQEGVVTSTSYIHTAATLAGTNVPIALYSLLSVAPVDGLMVVRNM